MFVRLARIGGPQANTTRCVVLAHTSHVSYATLGARAAPAPNRINGEQAVFYVVSGKGTVTSAGQTSELFDGMAFLLPPDVDSP